MAVKSVYALDLGTTRFKLGRLSSTGRLTDVHSHDAPEIAGSGLIREGDPADFLAAADDLLATIPDPHDAVLGLVSQRSTFTAWNRHSGEAIVPMISWQDRRADPWCGEHRDSETRLQPITGLPLSAHYAGPKLAAMQAQDPAFAAAFATGEVLFGTLDSWLIWHWTDGERHLTDITMAARTSLLDLASCQWSAEALRLFGVSRAALADVRATAGWNLELRNGLVLQANIADQGAGAMAVLRPGENAALINFGTGAFVLCPTARAITRRSGYLTGPIFGSRDGAEFAVEGTVNGAGPALDRFGAGPTHWPDSHDPCPQAFAIPDLAGLGSPHWRADISLEFSAAEAELDDADKRRVVLEGLLFRVYEILRDLGDGELPERIVVSGGLTRDPAVASGLAGLLGRPVEVLLEPEATLLGTVRIAAGLDAFAEPRLQRVAPASDALYLQEKFGRWRGWLESLL
jgi:glycerol kinase